MPIIETNKNIETILENVNNENASNCDDGCVIQIDIEQVEKIYDSLSKKIYDDMDKQYSDKKISGVSYADTWAKLMSAVVGGALNAVVAIQNKETAHDRLVKEQQIESSQIKSQNETCIAQSTCALNTAKKKAEDIKNGDAEDGDSLYGKNKNVLAAQDKLYQRQEKGFNDNARQKLLEAQLSAWSIVWRDGNGITIPCGVSKEGIDTSLDNVNNLMGKDHSGAGDVTPQCQAPAE